MLKMPIALVHNLEERHQLNHLAPLDAQARLVEMWLYAKSENSEEAYRRIVTNFLAFVAKPIPEISLEDLYQYAGHLEELKLSPSSQKTYLSIVKSLLSFATKIGMTQVNAGAALTLKSPPDSLSKRILSETEIILLTHAEKNLRNRLILRLFYAIGIRVSELSRLKWEDLTPRGDSGQLEVVGGKGGKSRSEVEPRYV
ncbi:tyrosine-type recombinase/integrase [Scytonema sp. NUACC26]|uniref:tyrosine-type recombinase/integrase n=1 Tax=Scytonema sp. NUACC26 TaxID=3140176 RepID=UPI0034DBC506